jgi:hypothetical protein
MVLTGLLYVVTHTKLGSLAPHTTAMPDAFGAEHVRMVCDDDVVSSSLGGVGEINSGIEAGEHLS